MDRFADIEVELNEVIDRTRRLVESTEPRLFTVRPNLSAWSASECIAHLSISTEQFLPVLRSSIEDARKRGIKPEKKPTMDFLGRILRWFLEPPVRSRVKTAARFVPKGVRAKAQADEAVQAAQRVKAEANEATLRAGVMPTGNASPDEGSGKKFYRRSDLIKMQINDPSRYEAMGPEILAAYSEGRVK